MKLLTNKVFFRVGLRTKDIANIFSFQTNWKNVLSGLCYMYYLIIFF